MKDVSVKKIASLWIAQNRGTLSRDLCLHVHVPAQFPVDLGYLAAHHSLIALESPSQRAKSPLYIKKNLHRIPQRLPSGPRNDCSIGRSLSEEVEGKGTSPLPSCCTSSIRIEYTQRSACLDCRFRFILCHVVVQSACLPTIFHQLRCKEYDMAIDMSANSSCIDGRKREVVKSRRS